MRRVIFDCSAVAYRAAHTLKLEADDVSTGVLWGFLNAVLEMGTKFSTNEIVFAFDTPTEDGVRRKAYPPYKCKRNTKQTPEDIAIRKAVYSQLDVLRTKILPGLGFTNIFRVDGYEADDIIASIVGVDHGDPRYCMGARLPMGCKPEDIFTIISADHDLYQLLGYQDRVTMCSPATKAIYTRRDFQREYEIVPERWPMVLAIAGCDTDEVEGLHGVGFKTAIKYLTNQSVRPALDSMLNSKEGKAICTRNFPLVALPYNTFPWDLIEIKPSDFKGRGAFFKEMCAEYHFATYLREPTFGQWKGFFMGGTAMPKQVSQYTQQKPIEAARGRVIAPSRSTAKPPAPATGKPVARMGLLG